MKTNNKKIIAMLISIVILISVIPMGGINAQSNAVAADVEGNWISAWSTSPVDASVSVKYFDKIGVPLYNTTSRVTIEPTMSGEYIRLVFSNEFGVLPLHIGSCNVATTKSVARSIDTDTTEVVTFGGKTKTDIPAGERILSDPVKIDVTAGNNITVSTYYSGLNVMKTVGLIGGHSYLVPGNKTKRSSLKTIELSLHLDSGAYEIIPALMEVDVLTDDPSAETCVIFGDSTVSNEVPRYFADILRENGIENVSITQAAIKGNRLIADGVGAFSKVVGQSSLKRFERDALNQAGVKTVIVKIGINDVVHPYCESKKDLLKPVTIDEMVEGYKALVKMAHDRGVSIYFCELTPWKGYTRNLLNKGDDVNWTPEIDKLRLEINEWFASDDNPADGFIQLPQLSDENDPSSIISRFTTDGIHYTDEGTKTLAEAMPLSIF